MGYKLIYNRGQCIGAGECAALAPQLWELDNEGKAQLRGAKLNPKTGNYELAIPDALVEAQQLVASSCPVGAISVEED